MPYLDLDDDDNLIHLWQLFLAAHPAYRESNDAMREVSDAPGEYFYNPDMTCELATWARHRSLITRKEAALLVEAALPPGADLAAIVSLTSRVLGTPPRLQPSVLSHEIVHWLRRAAPKVKPGEEVMVFTIVGAIAIVEAMMEEFDMSDGERARARQLIVWLGGQG